MSVAHCVVGCALFTSIRYWTIEKIVRNSNIPMQMRCFPDLTLSKSW